MCGGGQLKRGICRTRRYRYIEHYPRYNYKRVPGTAQRRVDEEKRCAGRKQDADRQCGQLSAVQSSIDIGRPFLAGDMGVLLSARSGASGSGRVPPSTVFFFFQGHCSARRGAGSGVASAYEW